MRYRLAEMPARPCAGRQDPSSFPARICRKTQSFIVAMAAIMLISPAVSVGGTAHAESVAAALPKTSPDAGPYANFVREAAQRFGVPASWIGAVMAIESGGDVLALSPQGAMGLMQIMPETWAGLRARHASVTVRMIRATTSLQARFTCASCMIATAHRAFWPPTMQVPGATTNTCRQAERCRTRPSSTWPRSRR